MMTRGAYFTSVVAFLAPTGFVGIAQSRQPGTASPLPTALSEQATAQSQQPAAQTQASAAPPGNAETGKTLFVKNGCYQCHNYEGHGGAAGARLAPGPLPFRAFLAYVRAPRGDMPPYATRVMSDQELADVYAYLRSRPRPPSVAQIPLLTK